RRDRLADPLPHSLHVRNGLLGVNGHHFAPRLARERLRVARRTHGDVERERRRWAVREERLVDGHVDFRLRFNVETSVLYVADDADDLYPVGLVALAQAGVGEALAYRLLARPVALGHRAADDGHARRAAHISVVEDATAKDGDAHCLEVAGRDEAQLLFGVRLPRRDGSA